MQKQIISPIILLLLFACSSPKKINSANEEINCETKWQYFKLTDTIRGTVVLHRKAMAACGRVPFASLTLVQTINKDTLRILELCSFKEFKVSDKVIVWPGFIPTSNDVQLPRYRTMDLKFVNDAFECSVTKTCWGSVITAN